MVWYRNTLHVLPVCGASFPHCARSTTRDIRPPLDVVILRQSNPSTVSSAPKSFFVPHSTLYTYCVAIPSESSAVDKIKHTLIDTFAFYYKCSSGTRLAMNIYAAFMGQCSAVAADKYLPASGNR